LKTEEQVQEQNSHFDVEERVKRFREDLDYLNKQYSKLISNRISGDFYIGPNSTPTYLPDKVIFKRTTTERF
jgi:hypothetical protein